VQHPDHSRLLNHLFKVALSGTVWLAFVEAHTLPQTVFADTHIPLDCEFLAAQSEAESGNVSITGVYNIHLTLPLQVYRAATWRPDRGFNWSTFAFRQKRADLQGVVIKGTYIIDVSN
jgi:hypothetical protein